MFTDEEINILQTALKGMVIRDAPISEQARFYAQKIMPLLTKLQAMKKEAASGPNTESKQPENKE